jgi:uncharacterized protein (DUF58 family)
MPTSVHIHSHARIPLIGVGLLALQSLLIPNHVWTLLLVALVGLIGVSYGWVRLLAQGLRAERKVRSNWVAVGDTLDEFFELKNDSPAPALWIEVRDETNVPGYRAATVRSVGAGEFSRWREKTRCLQRGYFTLGGWSLRTSDPLGLFEAVLRFDERQEIVIHPPVNTGLPFALPSGFGQGQTRMQRRAWQTTTNAAGIRDYRPNDPLNRIHWPTTAHRNQLTIREFERDTAGDIWVLLDMEQRVQVGSGLEGTEEQAVLIAAALTAQGLVTSRGVGLAAYGSKPQIVPPGRGAGQSWAILEGLAVVSADSTTPLAQAITDLSRIVRRGSAVFVVTGSADLDFIPALFQLRQLGVAVHCALFDRASFGGDGNSAAVQGELQRLAFPTTLLHKGDLNIIVPLKEEIRVTPLGKAVVYG